MPTRSTPKKTLARKKARRRTAPARAWRTPKQKPFVLVTGASGRLGRRVVPLLLANGFRVRAVDRSAETLRELPSKCEKRFLDLLQSSSGECEALCRECWGVVHLAGLVDYLSPPELIYRVNAGVTEKLAKAAKATNVQRFVHASSTSIYGNQAGVVTEDAIPAPVSAYGESKLWAERFVAQSRVPFVLLRFAMIYGPGFSEGFDTVFKQVRSGHFRLIGDGNNHVPFLHADDAARAVLAALKTKNINRAYNIAAKEMLTQRELVLAAALRLKTPLRLSSIPKRAAYSRKKSGNCKASANRTRNTRES